MRSTAYTCSSPSDGRSSASVYTRSKPAGYFSCARPELTSLVPRQALRVLDVGCGRGEFARTLRASRSGSKLEIIGLEVSEEAAEAARSALDRLIIGDIEEVALPYEDYFDCIVFADVLEHLIDPWTTLRRANSLLHKNATVVASIPNVQHWSVIGNLLRGRWEYSEFGIMDSTHLRFFTRKSIQSLFTASDFVVRDMFPLLTTRKAKIANRVTGAFAASFLTHQYVVVAQPARS
jgi:2-polyprenyl-3-methyl-5-hydroxy-6-metoxy-1,4-benzoquinol methylase